MKSIQDQRVVVHNLNALTLANRTATLNPVMHSGEDSTMFDRPGIGIEDLPWIHRDQFVHYLQLAHALSDPNDWRRLREDLLQALTAAFGLDASDANAERLTPSQRRAQDVLDEIRPHHNPARDWPAFFDTLWSQRHAIRPDLP